MSVDDHDSELEHEAPWRIDGPTPAQEVYEAFPEAPAAYGINPDDGLPQPRVPASIKLARAAPLLRETFVCMEDVRRFVIRDDWGRVKFSFAPEHVRRYEDGKYRVEVTPAVPHGMEALEYVVTRRGLQRTRHIEVEPVRPQCSHYARQLVDFPDDPDYRFVVRLCTARRTDSGEFLSLRDMKMYACELRNPRAYLVDEDQLVRSDEQRVHAAEQQRHDEQDFDPTRRSHETIPASPRPIFSDSPVDDS
jgi:hypothetical protein